MEKLFYFRTSNQTVAEQKKIEEDLSAQVDQANHRITEINSELESVMDQLGEAKVDKHESARAMKKKELLDNLKGLFSGVVSFPLFQIIVYLSIDIYKKNIEKWKHDDRELLSGFIVCFVSPLHDGF